MDILQAAQQIRPGTAWNFNGYTLSQAEDGTKRVIIPTPEELQAIIDSYIPPKSLEERIAELEQKVL